VRAGNSAFSVRDAGHHRFCLFEQLHRESLLFVEGDGELASVRKVGEACPS